MPLSSLLKLFAFLSGWTLCLYYSSHFSVVRRLAVDGVALLFRKRRVLQRPRYLFCGGLLRFAKDLRIAPEFCESLCQNWDMTRVRDRSDREDLRQV